MTDVEPQEAAPQPAGDPDGINVRRVVTIVVVLALAMAAGIGLCSLVMGVPEKADRTIFPADMVALRTWRLVVIHHTGTADGAPPATMHVHPAAEPGAAVGCHFVIGNGRGMGDGEIAATPLWVAQQEVQSSAGGEGAAGAVPPGAVHIVLVGDFGRDPPTPDQMRSLVRLASALAGHCRIPLTRVLMHSDLEAVACPGSAFPAADLMRRLGEKLRG